MEPVVEFATLLDWFIFIGGIVGCIGTLRGSKFFLDESRMQTLVEWIGARNVRLIAAAAYAMLAAIAGRNLFG